MANRSTRTSMGEPAPCDCSIVVVALAGGGALEFCLERLARWHDRCHVMLGEDMGTAHAWQARFPVVRFSECRELTVPMRRQRGVEAAQGEFVALLEDTSLPVASWLEGLCDAFTSEKVAAAAGPVTIDPALPSRGKALACTEYGRYHPARFALLALGPPDASGSQPVSRLPGNNIAYRRSALLQVLVPDGHGLLEMEVNEILKARGFVLALHPRMGVVYAAADPQGIRLGTRLQHGRIYASQRAQRWSYPARLAGVAGSLILPVVLSARALVSMTRAVAPAAWLPTAFWICAMESAWAAGEGIGYLAGAGGSLESWR